MYYVESSGAKPANVAGLKTLYDHMVAIGDQIAAERLSRAGELMSKVEGRMDLLNLMDDALDAALAEGV